MPENSYIVIADDCEREKVYAEFWINDEHMGEITQEGEVLLLTIFPRHHGGRWTFPLDDAIEFIQQARRKLEGGSSNFSL